MVEAYRLETTIERCTLMFVDTIPTGLEQKSVILLVLDVDTSLEISEVQSRGKAPLHQTIKLTVYDRQPNSDRVQRTLVESLTPV